MEWLLASDPAVRWQVLRDLTDASADEVAAERALVSEEGWGARLLALRDAGGGWAGGALFPKGFDGDLSTGQPWTATMPTLETLCVFGVDPTAPEMCSALEDVRSTVRWEHADEPFFDGETEPCINGRVVRIGAYFGVPVDDVVQRLLGEQLDDGGWNCEAENGSVRSSFHTTICVLEALLEHGGTATEPARRRAEEYLLERRLMFRRSTGELVDPSWQMFSFPTRWHYDVLRGLDYFRAAGRTDPRLSEALDLVRNKAKDGCWLLENTHVGTTWFDLEDGDGRPSRWNTLRALRVLTWAGRC